MLLALAEIAELLEFAILAELLIFATLEELLAFAAVVTLVAFVTEFRNVISDFASFFRSAFFFFQAFLCELILSDRTKGGSFFPYSLLQCLSILLYSVHKHCTFYNIG